MQVSSHSSSLLLLRKLLLSVSHQQVRHGATRAARVPPPIPSSGGRSLGAVLKTFKPLTPSSRHVKQPVHAHLWKKGPHRPLTIAKRGTGGRNNTGRIATRHRGGGHKRRIREVDFKRLVEGQQTVERIEYDPGRTAHIALVKHDRTGQLTYILAPEGLRAGDTIQSWPNGLTSTAPSAIVPSLSATSSSHPFSSSTSSQSLESESVSASSSSPHPSTSSTSGIRTLSTDPAAPQSLAVLDETGTMSSGYTSGSNPDQPASLTTSLLRTSMLRTGNQLPLHLLPPGTTVHCISLRPLAKASLCRSAGSYGKMVAMTSAGPKGSHYAQVQLRSGEVRKLNRNCTAVIGAVSNREHQNKVLGKAGRSRWLGRRPKVRGVAMNPTDHPHGGGRGKSKGNKHPRTPQGILTKGKRTRRPGPKGNRFVVRQRPRGKERKGKK